MAACAVCRLCGCCCFGLRRLLGLCRGFVRPRLRCRATPSPLADCVCVCVASVCGPSDVDQPRWQPAQQASTSSIVSARLFTRECLSVSSNGFMSSCKWSRPQIRRPCSLVDHRNLIELARRVRLPASSSSCVPRSRIALLVQHHDLIRMLDGGEPVRDDQCCTSALTAPQTNAECRAR